MISFGVRTGFFLIKWLPERHFIWNLLFDQTVLVFWEGQFLRKIIKTWKCHTRSSAHLQICKGLFKMSHGIWKWGYYVIVIWAMLRLSLWEIKGPYEKVKKNTGWGNAPVPGGMCHSFHQKSIRKRQLVKPGRTTSDREGTQHLASSGSPVLQESI